MKAKQSIASLALAALVGMIFFPGINLTSMALADTVEITYVTWKAGHPQQVMVNDLMKRIEQKSGGVITFKSKGNEESIAPGDQVNAVMRGVIDAGMINMSAMADRMPIANAMSVLPLKSQDQKAKGIYDVFQKAMNEKGMHLICNLDSSNYNHQFRLWLNRKISKPEDIKGMKLRTISKYAILAKKYGASPMNIPAPDLYTSVQQGLVDGYFMSFAAMDLGLGEVTKYYLDPGFGRSDEVFYMSLEKWNRIPPELQKLVIEEVNTVEKEWETKWAAQYDKQKEKAASHGVKIIAFPEAEAARIVNDYNDLVWEDVVKKAPADGNKMRELCGLPAL